MTLAPKSRLARVGLSAIVIAAAAGMTLGVTTLLGITFQGSGEAHLEHLSPPADVDQQGEQSTAVAGSSAPSICVEAVDFDAGGEIKRGSASTEAEAKAALEPALTEAATHQYWYAAGLAEREKWVVDIGCPSLPLPYVTRSTAKWEGGRPLEYVPPLTGVEPTLTYQALVFVMPLEDIDQLLGGTISRVVPQEMECEGPTCSEVRSAVYVTPEEAADRAFMTRLLQVALGLESPFPNVRTIDDELADIAREVPGFGGYYRDFDNPDILKIVLKNPDGQLAPALESMPRHLTDNPFTDPFSRLDRVEAVQGEYSFLELHEWHVLAVPQVHLVPGVEYSGVDEVSNRLKIGVSTAEAEGAVRLILSDLGVPSEASVIAQSSPIRSDQ